MNKKLLILTACLCVLMLCICALAASSYQPINGAGRHSGAAPQVRDDYSDYLSDVVICALPACNSVEPGRCYSGATSLGRQIQKANYGRYSFCRLISSQMKHLSACWQSFLHEVFGLLFISEC